MSFWTKTQTMIFEATGPLERVINAFVDALPALITCTVVVIGGLIAAPLAAKITQIVVRRSGLETLLEQIAVPRLLYRVGYKHSTAVLLGTVVRVAIYLFTALVATDILGLKQVSSGFDTVIGYMPRVFVATIFLMVGVWAADLARGVVAGMSKEGQGEVIGTAIYYGVIAITVALVADQLGLQTSLINNIILLAIGGAALSVALGMGLSAKPTLANLLARNYVAQLYVRGDRVRIDGIEGIVKSHSPTALVVVGEHETYNVPYTRFMNAVVATCGDARPLTRNGSDGEPESASDDADASE